METSKSGIPQRAFGYTNELLVEERTGAWKDWHGYKSQGKSPNKAVPRLDSYGFSALGTLAVSRNGIWLQDYHCAIPAVTIVKYGA
jgi:hypothetical protein